MDIYEYSQDNGETWHKSSAADFMALLRQWFAAAAATASHFAVDGSGLGFFYVDEPRIVYPDEVYDGSIVSGPRIIFDYQQAQRHWKTMCWARPADGDG